MDKWFGEAISKPSPTPPTRRTVNFLRYLHGHADGADRASVYERAFEGGVRARAHGSPRSEVRHARGRDGVHYADGGVDVTKNRVGGHVHASR